MYVWSIVMEPLLFFSLAENSAVGISANPGRILQAIVWIGLILGWLFSQRRLRLFNPAHPLYANYSLYFLCSVVAGAIGIAAGSYALHAQYSAANASTFIASVIRGPLFRPFFEYVILIYYFVYFVVLPRYLLNSDQSVAYFFRVFRVVFATGLALGAMDLILFPLGIEFIPRHMTDGVHVGFRFHGLAGEPRDAFVYLLFGLATLSLREFYVARRPLGNLWVAVILAAVLFTQSASGMFGLLFAGLLVLAFSVRYLSARTLAVAGVFVVALAGAIYAGVYFSPRVQIALKALSVIFDTLDRGGEVPRMMVGQMSNVYPLWDIYQKFKDGDFLQAFFGSGLGSASVVNNNLGGFGELANPHTQIVRVIYESGFLGLYFLIMSFAAVVRRLTVYLPSEVRRRFLFLTLLLVGVFLSHRSSVPFIFLGIFIVVMQRIETRAREGAVQAAGEEIR